MANVADRSVDWALSSIRSLNASAAREAARIKANRAAYMTALRSLPSIKDAAAREKLRGQLSTWIRSQLSAESKFQAFDASFTSAKASLKKFLQSIHVSPPGYLGAVPLVPLAIAGAIVVALATVAVIASTNARQEKSIQGLNALVQSAAAQGWSAEDTTRAIQAYQGATDAAAPAGDPLGIGRALEAALPVVLGIGAIVLVMKMMPARRAA